MARYGPEPGCVRGRGPVEAPAAPESPADDDVCGRGDGADRPRRQSEADQGPHLWPNRRVGRRRDGGGGRRTGPGEARVGLQEPGAPDAPWESASVIYQCRPDVTSRLSRPGDARALMEALDGQAA